MHFPSFVLALVVLLLRFSLVDAHIVLPGNIHSKAFREAASSTAAAPYGFITKTLKNEPSVPATMTVPRGCATPVSVSKIQLIPHGVFDFPELPNIHDGTQCCEACYSPQHPNCMIANWDPPRQRCTLGINKEPMNGSLTSDSCPHGLIEQGDIDETSPTWNHFIVGPCWMPGWQGPAEEAPLGGEHPGQQGGQQPWPIGSDELWDPESQSSNDPHWPNPRDAKFKGSQWDTSSANWGGHRWQEQNGGVGHFGGPREFWGPRQFFPPPEE